MRGHHACGERRVVDRGVEVLVAVADPGRTVGRSAVGQVDDAVLADLGVGVGGGGRAQQRRLARAGRTRHRRHPLPTCGDRSQHVPLVVAETLGAAWMTNEWFRFGASSLANDLLRQIARREDGHYQSPRRFSVD